MNAWGKPVEKIYERGLTIRSFLGILYAAIIVQPAMIWIYFTTGNLIVSLAAYASIFLFSEFASWSGKGLTKQEIFIFLFGCSVATGSLFFPTLIYNLYFKRHPLTVSTGISQLLPKWFAPSLKLWHIRTFVHPEFILPIMVYLFAMFCGVLSNLALGFLTRELYIVEENLPFPLQQVDAEICKTLAERKGKRLGVFIICALIGIVYGAVVYAIPSITYAALNLRIALVPLPWIDLNFLIENLFPGASFGISTEPSIIALGLILPSTVTISVFIGSMTLYFFGNWMLVTLGLFKEWTPGMNVQNAWQRSVLHFWAGPNVMLAIAAGVLPLIFHPKPFINSIKSLLRFRKGVSTFSLKTILVMYFFGTVLSVILSHFLVPNFPLWILLLLSVGWTFLLNLVSARSLGITGMAINIPYVREGTILASGYSGYDVWFAPIVFPGPVPEGASLCANFKVADLVSTYPMDVAKTYILAASIGVIFNFLYTQLFWSIAPVPSSLFPAPFWDINTTMTILFLTKQITIFKLEWFLPTFIIATIIQSLIEFLHLPLSLIGIVVGAASPIPNSIGLLIGLSIGKILEHFFGKSWLNEHKTSIVAGLLTGEGIIVTLSTAISMILKSFWISAA